MIVMTTAIILAGGDSTRMGEDKALMIGGVSRLVTECHNSTLDRVIILCGESVRAPLFSGEVWPDPAECQSIVEVIKWCLKQIPDDIIIIPCDAFNLDSQGIAFLCEQRNCVAVDSSGLRQPLLCRISDREMVNWNGNTINAMFNNLPSFTESHIAHQFDNFNYRSDLKNLLSPKHR